MTNVRSFGGAAVKVLLVFAMLVGVAYLVLRWLFAPARGVIDDATFISIRVGMDQVTAEHKLGQPLEDPSTYTSMFSPPVAGSHCDYFAENMSVMEPWTFRVCYRNGKVVSTDAWHS